jgi:TRAP-type C4-dicarboxylate transport system permease small subunit
MTDEAKEPRTEESPFNSGTLTPLDRQVARGGNVVALLFLASALIIAFEVIARYVFDSPTVWVHETTTFICALCFAYGGSYCVARNKHIRIVLIYDAVSEKTRRILDIVLSTLGVILSGTLTYAAWTLVEKSFFAPTGEFRMETSGSAWDPTFPAWIKLSLFVALLIMTFQYIWHLIHHIRREPDV